MSAAAPHDARTVLCFGDSNTWGFVPGSAAERFARSVRWPGVLADHLGAAYHVIEEGLSGRTTVLENPITPHRNGREYLIPCLDSHKPLDLAIIFLGTNDLADRYTLPPLDIARAAVSLAQIVRTSQAGPRGSSPAVLLTDLPRLGRIDALADTMSGAPARSRELPRCFRTAAAEAEIPLLELSEVVAYSDIDGIHLDAAGHRTVGLAVAAMVAGMIG